MDEREAKLPAWARGIIAGLRSRLSVATENLAREVGTLRDRNAKLKSRNEAMIELVECAANGGHPTCVEIAKMIEAYGIEPAPEVIDDRDSVLSAINLAFRYGGIDGSHHKQWVIDQIVRLLTGKDYNKFVKQSNHGEDGPNTYTWDTGTPP